MRYEVELSCCRICLQQDRRMRNIYKAHDEGDETPNDMLTQLLGDSYAKLNQIDIVPEIICKECELALSMAFQFRERALKTQTIIEEFCNENGIVFEDANSIDDMFYKGVDSGGAGADDVVAVEEDIVEEQDIQEVVEYEDGEEQPEYETQRNDDIEVDIEMDCNSNEHEQIAILPDDEIEYLEESLLEVDPNPEESESDVVENCALSNELRTVTKRPRTTVRRDRRLSQSVKLEPGTNAYICDVCGNRYEKRGRMLEHRRRHDLVQHYQCELCEKRFPTREQLRKHIYSHTGTKPFKCSFCSRTFYYESVLKAHENVHRGVKPYICTVCDKPFAYSHSLTKHELIHKDIKMFHCQFCKKDFRLPHHLRQHEDTKCHQNAVAQAMKNDENFEIKEENSLFSQ